MAQQDALEMQGREEKDDDERACPNDDDEADRYLLMLALLTSGRTSVWSTHDRGINLHRAAAAFIIMTDHRPCVMLSEGQASYVAFTESAISTSPTLFLSHSAEKR